MAINHVSAFALTGHESFVIFKYLLWQFFYHVIIISYPPKSLKR